ncbi:MAG: GTP pyrophosphokinase family protein [Oscillospiraceae bacterium]|nr:GTP pyrophosphokinase family protein [Oscillospiraceae bacterium]
MEEKFTLNTIKHMNQAQQKEIFSVLQEFIELEHLYESASEIVKTQLHIYDSEFSVKFQRNPIHSIESRIKSPQSIIGKLQKKGLALSAKSAKENLMDIAGIRVVCYYIDDIYAIVELLNMQREYKIVKIKDYIKNPKPSGYRSLHVILMIPVYLATQKKEVPVEIQIRTIAMDFWASLEHQLHYKTSSIVPESLKRELQECAEVIADTDLKMQDIYQQIYNLD